MERGGDSGVTQRREEGELLSGLQGVRAFWSSVSLRKLIRVGEMC